jgi:hypothetical protein
MSNKHTATFQGHTWRRVSQNRTYTHMVVKLAARTPGGVIVEAVRS